MIVVERLPREIVESKRCVVWRYVQRPGQPKPTKPPFQARRPDRPADVTDPSTWGTFAEALAVVLRGAADGLGIVLGDGIVGIDLDDVRDPVNGAITPEALAIIRSVDSFAEASPTGTGVHILARGTLPPGRRRTGFVEMYDCDRFFTVTGEHVSGTPTTIEERTAQLAALHARIFGTNGNGSEQRFRSTGTRTVDRDDATLIERACSARNGAKFARLWAGDWSGYPSQSEGDQALCNLLSYWTDGDPDRVDALFRRSGLMRAKWDERRGSQTYGERTIATAIAACR
jgi:putative DNA primase/helicase